MRMWESTSSAKTVTSNGVTLKQKSDADDFYVFMYDEEDKQSFKQTTFKKKGGKKFELETKRVFGFWCFNAGVGFRKIQALNPRSVILTSGTLSPLSSFEAELQMEFKHKLENPHVINPDQVNISILKNGIQSSEFKFDY